MRHKRKPRSILKILFLSIWIPICFSTGFVLALLIPAQNETDKSTQAPSPQPIPTAAPIRLSASYDAFTHDFSLRGDDPKILIYHTHTTEAYLQTEQFSYVESTKWRTFDQNRSVVAVGEALKSALERYGFSVLHDTTDHEPPKLSTAYDRSEQTMLAYRERYPSLVLFIDLHRDAFGKDPSTPMDYLVIDGAETARLMLVVGQGEKYSEKPYFACNYRMAENIMEHLNDKHEKLMRPIRIKPGRYNQHVAPHCLLVEVGHNANTLEQAMHAVPYLAESIAFAAAKEQSLVYSWVPVSAQN